MVRPGTVRRYVGLSLTVGVGAGLVLAHVGHALGARESIQTFLLGILIPMIFASGVFVGGLWIRQQGVEDKYILRVGGWCTLGAALLALGGVLVILYQQEYGVVMDEKVFVVINGASGGAFVGFLVGVYNIRQRQAQTRADQLARQLTVLNRVLRHDIRNTANIIQANAELLTDEPGDTATKVDTIKQQATDLVTLGKRAKNIEQVLIEQGENHERVDIASRVRTCCDRIRRDYPVAEIETSLPSTLPVITHQLIDSALMNVIENAVEHNDKRVPHVTIESTVVSRDGTDYVELEIADNGPGIADYETSVLERGYETDLEHTSGLGLWLVSWIVTNADGHIRFEENEPEGSIVCLWLKRAEENVSVGSVSNTADAVE